MSEANSTAVQEKPKKKRRSLWWLNLLLTLIVFGGGVVLGLMLHTMPEPYAMVERYFPQLVPQSAVTAEATAVAVTPAPTPTPAPTEAPKPTEAPAPAETPQPAETLAPTEAPQPVETEPPEQPETVPVIGGADAPNDIQVVDGIDAPSGILAGHTDDADAGETRPAADKAPTETIGVDAALEAALERAGLREDDVEVYGIFRTKDDELTVFQVEFAADGVEYVYFVNAFSGGIEGWRTVRDGQSKSVPEEKTSAKEQSAALSIEEAKAIALRHAGVKSSEATNVSVELRSKNGMSWYEISFKSDGHSYTYRIDSAGGDVLFHDKTK